MRNTTKVAIGLALAMLVVTVVVPKAAGISSQSNAGTSTGQGIASNTSELPSGPIVRPIVTPTGAIVYDGPGCQDLSAQVTGYDSLTGAPCPYTGP